MRILMLASLLAAGLAGPALAQNAPPAKLSPTAVLATVNGEAITEADIATAVEDVAAEYPNLDPAKLKEVTLDFLIEMKVVAQQAKAEKIDETDEFKQRVAYIQQRLMMQQLMLRESKTATSDAALRKFFDEQVAQIKPAEEVRARHILVESEDEAKAIAARLKNGEDFVQIAKEASKDPGSGAEGGDLGFFSKDRMVPEFAEAAFALKPGEVSAPVKSQFGWHVIRLEERRAKPLPAFEQVKDRVAQALSGKVQTEYLNKLKSAAKIERK